MNLNSKNSNSRQKAKKSDSPSNLDFLIHLKWTQFYKIKLSFNNIPLYITEFQIKKSYL